MTSHSTAHRRAGRPPGLEVDPARVRSARLAAGLSLAQLAGGEVTRGAIYLVETGRARPSKRTLELIARKTGKPAAFFLSAGEPDRRWVNEARAQLDAGGFDQVAQLAESRLRSSADPMERATALYLRGAAAVGGGRPLDGAHDLELALAVLEGGADEHLAVECRDYLGLALYRSEDLRAATVLEDALRRCRELAIASPELESRILGHLGALHASKHEWERAADLYEAAVGAAGNLAQLNLLARMHHDLAGAAEALGDRARALASAWKALAIYELLGDQSGIARVENNLGWMLLRSGELTKARGHLEKSLRLCEQLGLQSGRAHVLDSLAELELAEGNPEAARQVCSLALPFAAEVAEPLSLAALHQVHGRALSALGELAQAGAEFAAAAALLEANGATERLVELQAAWADALHGQGHDGDAYEHLARALQLARPDLGDRAQPRLLSRRRAG